MGLPTSRKCHLLELTFNPVSVNISCHFVLIFLENNSKISIIEINSWFYELEIASWR